METELGLGVKETGTCIEATSCLNSSDCVLDEKDNKSRRQDTLKQPILSALYLITFHKGFNMIYHRRHSIRQQKTKRFKKKNWSYTKCTLGETWGKVTQRVEPH